MVTSTGHQDVPIRWRHLPRGTCQKASKTSDGHNFGKCWPIRTKLGSVMYVNMPQITAPYLLQCATFVAKRHFRHHVPFWPPIKAYQTWYRFKSQPSDPQRSQKRCPGPMALGWILQNAPKYLPKCNKMWLNAILLPCVSNKISFCSAWQMHFTSVINRNWYPYANPENFVSNPVTTVIYDSSYPIKIYELYFSVLLLAYHIEHYGSKISFMYRLIKKNTFSKIWTHLDRKNMYFDI